MKLIGKQKKKTGRRPFAADVLFSSVRDDYGTPQDFYDELDAEFHFVWDFAADKHNAKAPAYFGPDRKDPAYRDALKRSWFKDTGGAPGFLNPPYTKTAPFLKKASEEAKLGQVTVALIPSRTETRYWHKFLWDRKKHRPRPGVEIRFPKGRLKFTLHVTKDMRKAVFKEAAMWPGFTSDVQERTVAKKLGLPLQIIRAILNKEPEVVTSAPFPNAIVIFRKPPARPKLTG